MATTEAEKILDTILSRVQEFDFKRATNTEIEEDLGKIVASEKMKIDPEALTLIAQGSDGSFRNAETILDQIDFEIGMIFTFDTAGITSFKKHSVLRK